MTVMKDTDYYKSGKQKENVLKARELATEASRLKKLQRIEEYNKNPTRCRCCDGALSYTHKRNQFCSSTCSGRFNNKARRDSGWSMSETSKAQISASLKSTINEMSDEDRKQRRRTPPKARLKNPDVDITCSVCKKVVTVPFIKRRYSTCGSVDCKVYASVGMRTYQNGSRKPVWFFNPHQGKDVLLESSWEVKVATLLIELGVKWIRPPFIKWIDSKGIQRRYFPDFYLVDYDVYLDPKNPYCMVKDIEKMAAVSAVVHLVYGSLDVITSFILQLT